MCTLIKQVVTFFLLLCSNTVSLTNFGENGKFLIVAAAGVMKMEIIFSSQFWIPNPGEVSGSFGYNFYYKRINLVKYLYLHQ